MASILLICPDRSLSDYAAQVLTASAHQVTSVDSPGAATAASVSISIDLVVADSLTPSLAELRELFDAPFVYLAAGTGMLPGRLPVRDGDHVVAKPVAADDLRSAVAAALNATIDQSAEVALDNVVLDRDQQLLRSPAGSVALTPIEFQLFDYLARANGTIASTEDLLQNVWQYAPGTGSSDVIRSHLKNLRAKLREIAVSPNLIETVPRRGYRLSG